MRREEGPGPSGDSDARREGWGERDRARSDDREIRRDACRTRRAERREARARERETLKRLPRKERLGAWWRSRPLGVTFAVYLGAYLAVATVVALSVIEVFAFWNDSLYELEVTFDNGLTAHGTVDSGPYIYDAVSDRLLPASELDLPGDDPYAVFIATDSGNVEGAADLAGADALGGDVAAVSGREHESDRGAKVFYATLDQVRDGAVRLYDWGLNYNEWYPQEEVLGSNHDITAENIARYDKLSRENRAQSVELFSQMTGVDLAGAFGENLVSNTAYYATPAPPTSVMPQILSLVTGLSPVMVYGGLGWIMFRRFYRVHIEQPLGELSAAAQRITAQDLDFSIESVRGRELGRLSKTLEVMRASLLEAQRELWRTAEERRCLNAAFAHDMRTPVTVLKGTVEMAKMRLARGAEVDERELDTIAGQAVRLERYAQAMSGVAKLEDRPVEREEMAIPELVDRLRAHAVEVVAARAGELKVCLEGDCEDGATTLQTAWVDLALVEEVLDNLLSNACGHARECITVLVRSEGGMLDVCVTDDGDGFTPEALRRGCDPFYSENKSAEHFGLGLNISHILCGLHGGSLDLSNAEQGGARVCAHFEIGADRNPVEDGSKSDDPGLDENSKKRQGGGRGFSRFACPQKSRRG